MNHYQNPIQRISTMTPVSVDIKGIGSRLTSTKASAKGLAKASANASAKTSANPSGTQKKSYITRNQHNKTVSKTRARLNTIQSASKLIAIEHDLPKQSYLKKNKTVTNKTESKIRAPKIYIENAAATKISNFMKANKRKSRSRYIKQICSDPGLCIAFDTPNRQKINEHFNFFSSLRFLSDDIHQIGKKSANGFVKELKFTHDDYTAYAVLKSSKSSDTYTSDNLVYEYIAGQYINYQCHFLPCFVETYGLFYYKDDLSLKLFEENITTTPEQFTDGLELQTTSGIDYAKACKQSQYAAILLQYIHGAQVLHSFISNKVDYISYQMIYQMPYLLYQVYFALSRIKRNFTHYDLHTSNVMLYQPEKGKYIEYVYHLHGNKEVRFRCPYLVKIIDYGRSFFKWDPSDIDKNNEIQSLNIKRNPALLDKERIYLSSPEIYKHLCEESECNVIETDQKGDTHEYSCGKKSGFSWLDNPKKKTTRKYFISSSRSNVSHDLRLLYIVGQTLLYKKAPEFNTANRLPDEVFVSDEMAQLFKKVVYAVGLNPDDHHSGTEENKTSGLPNHIHNVSDAEKSLQELITSRKFMKLNKFKYPDESNRLGTLHIYTDGTQMKFER